MAKVRKDYPITLTFDDPTFRVIITLATNYQLDLTKSDFNELIGYDKKILKDRQILVLEYLILLKILMF